MGEFRYVGTDKLKTMGRAACKTAVQISSRELKTAVITDTPVDKGTLAGSTRVIPTKMDGNTALGGVRQGGAKAWYAVIVHNKWSHRGPARQVEVPLIRHRARHVAILAAAGRKVFGR
jgi:hypothetical protein